MFKAPQWLLDLPNKCQSSYMAYKALLNLSIPFLILSHLTSFFFLPQVLWSSQIGLFTMPCSSQTCSPFRAFALFTHYLVPASSSVMLFPRHPHGSLTFLMSYLKYHPSNEIHLLALIKIVHAAKEVKYVVTERNKKYVEQIKLNK